MNGTKGTSLLKICISNYGKWKKPKAMETLLSTMNVQFKSVKKVNGQPFGYITFENEENRDEALLQLKDYDWNGSKLQAVIAKPKLSVKRRAEEQGDENNAKRVCEGEVKTILDVVTPWYKIPYADQLEKKDLEMRGVMTRMVRNTRKEFYKHGKKQNAHVKKGDVPLPNWLDGRGSVYTIFENTLHVLSEKNQIWKPLGNSDDMDCILSLGGVLLGYNRKEDGLFKYNDRKMKWTSYATGHPESVILKMASQNGKLMCLLADGRFVRAEGLEGSLPTQWTTMEVHNLNNPENKTFLSFSGNLYAFESGKGGEGILHQAVHDETNVRTFAPFFIPEITTIISQCFAHNGILFIVCTDGTMWSMATNEEIFTVVPQAVEGMARIATLDVTSNVVSHKGVSCDLDSIIPSPITSQDRNKCEFSIGYDTEGKSCVGYRQGLFKDGTITIASPQECGNVPDEMKKLCTIMQNFVETSPFSPYNREEHIGVWRSLLVRCSKRTGNLLAMIQLNPSGLDAELYAAEKARLVVAFSTAISGTTSLYLQEYEGVSTPKEDDPILHLSGKTHWMEEMMGLRFQVSPQAFFQVNTIAAELLYQKVCDLANVQNKTVYDVCCGTGTIGLCASKLGASKVIGIELCSAAIVDANVNVTLNNISNVSFINDKAENVMRELLTTHKKNSTDADELVAIVDPPRGGLHLTVIKALRACEPLQRIVYVSCNPSGTLVSDITRLCGPTTKGLKGTAFHPTYAVPVDLFPNTPHAELVVVLERCKTEETK